MKKIYNFFVFTLLLIFTISTQGIMIFIHHCNKENSTHYSVYTPTNCNNICCHNNIENKSCSNSCSNECANSNMSKECCSDHHLLIKADLKDFINSNFKKINVKKTAVFYKTCLNDFLLLAEKPIITQLFKNKPPPKQGVFLIILYQNIKIPSFLS